MNTLGWILIAIVGIPVGLYALGAAVLVFMAMWREILIALAIVGVLLLGIYLTML